MGQTVEKPEGGRNQRIFSLFSVVTFPNQQCSGASSTSSATVFGTCYSSSECSTKGGAVDGHCAAGFGVCCTFLESTCGSTISNNCTYIQNPGYPSAYTTAGSCQYSVAPINSDICQLRLDLDVFDIAETTTTGACVDTFDVTTGSSRDYYALCGTLTGQHLYLETARSTASQVLSFTVATSSGSATFRIKVSQVECSSISKAPTDCLQYFTGTSGTVESLNYPTVMLAEIQYTICTRREEGYCGISWAQTAGTSPDTFDLDNAEITDGLAFDADASDAYILIPGSLYNEYGGNVLTEETASTDANMDTTAGTVEAYGVPNRLTVVSHTATSATATATGFSLVYRLLPCQYLPRTHITPA